MFKWINNLRGKASTINQLLRFQEANARQNVTDAFKQHSWVHACITVLMRKISSVPFVVVTKESDDRGVQTELANHPASLLLRNPNEVMGRSQLWQFTTLYLFDRGHAFWLLDIPEGTTRIQGIFPVAPNKAKPIYDDTDPSRLIGWKFDIGRRQGIPFTVDEVVSIPLPNPSDPLFGFAPGKAAELAINQDFKAALHNESLMENQSTPRGLLVMPEHTSEDEFKRTVKTWERGHKAARTRGRMGFVKGDVDFKPLGMTMQELDFLEGRRFNREEVLAVFGVPPAEVGVHDFSNYANAEAQGFKFWNNTLIPVLVMIEEILQAKFFGRHFSDVTGFFDLANVPDLQDDLSVKSDVARKLWTMGVPFSDINARLQMGFDTDGIDHLNQGWLPLSLVPEGGSEPGAGMAQASFVPAHYHTQQKQRRERLRATRETYDRITQGGVRRMAGRLTDYFEAEGTRIRAAVIRNYNELAERQSKAIDKWNAKERDVEGWSAFSELHMKGFSEDVQDLIFSIDESTGNLLPIAESELSSMVADGGNASAQLVGLTFDTDAPGALEAVSRRVNMIVTARNSGVNIPATTFDKVKDSLSQSIRDGASVSQAADGIEELYRNFDRNRSLVIAQTEMGYAYNAATNEFYQQAGIERHEWLSAGDADVRPTHQITGETVEVGQPFSNGLKFPNDPGGPPEEVINCRCTSVPIVDAQQNSVVTYRKKRIRRVNGHYQTISK